MYRKVTHDIEVTVEPSFMPEHSSPEKRRFVWAYEIEIRNLGPDTVRLRNRHWMITDANGEIEEVRGAGVVGEQPTLEPGSSFRYTSGCPLATSSGIMVGDYEMERETGERFFVDIPAFSLDLPNHRPTVN
ncbi:Co2+/Mg2+ efflux protein ApaG [Acuticoccus sp. M5D2P5]|uniref:Co2+/Mg2+ efflux protein ApaG n=1 Tax=Acuticoccus kalidii TaxID=2910977 RepID=UPI001F27826D|nr:Co2+/Mg2+ efflux protein ApaG [Acuticoccus kalidii]MCF3933642.1 Co2+/Mg2+ efflux protein ApaG [Acuticoccus kalidii]